MAIYYYCSRIMPGTSCWEGLKNLLNIDLEGKRRKITFISGSINDKSKSKSYRNGASKNLVELGIEMEEFTLLWKDDNQAYMVDQVLEADIVYLLGGNPHNQTRYIKDHGLEDIFGSYNGIIVGVSCGAMTMSKNVIVPPCGETYPSADIRPGIGLSDLSIFPHFDYAINQSKVETKDGYIEIQELLKISNEYKMLGLPNESIIRCHGGDTHLLGESPYIISEGNVYYANVTEDKLDTEKVKKLTL